MAGRGTLAPWARPRQLVTSGPYRLLTRNPMYICVAFIPGRLVCALGFEAGLHIYAVVTMCILVTRVLVLEEKWVAREFGPEWSSYRARTPRWLL